MTDDEMVFLFEDEKTSIYPTLISSIIAVIATAVLVWLLFEAMRRVQMGDYSLFVILLVFVSGAVLIAYSIFVREDEKIEL